MRVPRRPRRQRRVVLKRLGARETDRYGRLDGACVHRRERRRALVAGGTRARRTRAGFGARRRRGLRAGRCCGEEQAARAAKLGLWGEPYYVINKAEDPAGVLKSRGRFALVEGKVESVRESGGTI